MRFKKAVLLIAIVAVMSLAMLPGSVEANVQAPTTLAACGLNLSTAPSVMGQPIWMSSCRDMCKFAYLDCLDSGTPQTICAAERSACLANC